MPISKQLYLYGLTQSAIILSQSVPKANSSVTIETMNIDIYKYLEEILETYHYYYRTVLRNES